MSIQSWPSSIRAIVQGPRPRPRLVHQDTHARDLASEMQRTYWSVLRDVLPLMRHTPGRSATGRHRAA